MIVSDDLKKMRKIAVQFKVISKNMHGETEEENVQSK
jgi:hypothetical protein